LISIRNQRAFNPKLCFRFFIGVENDAAATRKEISRYRSESRDSLDISSWKSNVEIGSIDFDYNGFPRFVRATRKQVIFFVRYDSLKIGGVLYIIAAFQFFVFELVSETLYAGYSVANNYISDLGATCVAPPSTSSCLTHQPSATIFDTTVFLLGLILLVGTIFVYRGTRKKPYFIVTLVADIAVLLVGVFPENTGWIHVGISIVLFLFLGISLILSWTIVRGSVFRYLTVAFGALTLYFNYLPVPAALGVGGDERLIVISALAGILALGGYLTGQVSSPVLVAKQDKVPVPESSP
jgi:hypothetical membrane protein